MQCVGGGRLTVHNQRVLPHTNWREHKNNRPLTPAWIWTVSRPKSISYIFGQALSCTLGNMSAWGALFCGCFFFLFFGGGQLGGMFSPKITFLVFAQIPISEKGCISAPLRCSHFILVLECFGGVFPLPGHNYFVSLWFIIERDSTSVSGDAFWWACEKERFVP